MFKKGFTILELIVSIAIFALMTALVISKYGTFNQGVILTNLAYDIALSIRNAQSYGLKVKSSDRDQNYFSGEKGGTYGVHFSKVNLDNTEFTFFVDLGVAPNGSYSNADSDGDGKPEEYLSKTIIKNGSRITKICTGMGECNVSSLDITFSRPNPNAIIKADGVLADKAYIFVSSRDDNYRIIHVNSIGQISVMPNEENLSTSIR
jgi:prepilin-type N-terminal cleavage/methylation domain-containing protein